MQARPGEVYRKHSGQHTVTAAYHDEEEKTLRQQIAIDRAEALHASGWRWSPAASHLTEQLTGTKVPASPGRSGSGKRQEEK